MKTSAVILCGSRRYAESQRKEGKTIVGLIATVFLLFTNLFSSCSLMFQGASSSIAASTYPSQDEDMLAAEAQYCAMEAELQARLDNYEAEHDYDEYHYEQFPEKAKISRNTEEVQAESISYAVCAYFGIETGENSFGYIATWSKGKELPELKASLETINRTASGLITDIDLNYKALMKERGLDKEPETLHLTRST